MRWPGAFLYMPWILEWNVEEFKIHIHCCFKNICPKNISSGRYERGQNSYPPLFKNFKVPTNGGNLSCFSYFTDSLIQVKVYLIYITKLRVYDAISNTSRSKLSMIAIRTEYFILSLAEIVAVKSPGAEVAREAWLVPRAPCRVDLFSLVNLQMPKCSHKL